MQTLIDYRNARYQGESSVDQTRNGFGILVDDDLSFYASQWRDGKLNDSTVIYISHGKYIYGQWQDNQPHGLNVFRIGDTVVLGQFDNGYLKNKVLIIFQKFNFVAILEQKGTEWAVCERGILKNYNQLIKYIQEANIPMKPQFFSLTKYLTFISNEKASAVPCQGSQNCYFGYGEGLGIVFNSNNGVVSVGCHEDKKLSQFGGKYQFPKYVFQGNFKTSQIVKYTTDRPKQQIYSIFQKIHKRSLNFKNQYFDSKVKLLTHIQQLIRTKIDQITNPNNEGLNQNTFTAVQLNDSLDYHVENLEQINKINKIREQVYQPCHPPLKKTTSQYVQASPRPCKKSIPSTPIKKKPQPIINAPTSPIVMKKSPIKIKQKMEEKEKPQIQQRQKSLTRTPSKKSYITKIEIKQFKQQTFAQLQQQTFAQIKNSRTHQQESSSTIKRPISQIPSKNLYQQKHSNQQHEIQSPIDNLLVSSKNYIKQKQLYNVPSFKYTCSDFDKTIDNVVTKSNKNVTEAKITGSQKLQRIQRQERIQKIQNVQWIDSSNGSRCSVSPLNAMSKRINVQTSKQISKSPIKGPNYENLQQRRQRLLKQFKNLSSSESPSPNPSLTANSKIIPSLLKISTPINYQQSQPYPTSSVSPIKSPLISSELSSLLNQNAYTLKNNSYQYLNKQSSQKVPEYNYKLNQIQSPCARQKLTSYESKNTEQSQSMMPLTICKSSNQISGSGTNLENWKQNPLDKNELKYMNSKQSQNLKSKIVGGYQINTSKITEKSYKQNLDNSPIGLRPFEKKDSYYEKTQQAQRKQQQRPKVNIQQLTPNRRKAYKYYFDNQ